VNHVGRNRVIRPHAGRESWVARVSSPVPLDDDERPRTSRSRPTCSTASSRPTAPKPALGRRHDRALEPRRGKFLPRGVSFDLYAPRLVVGWAVSGGQRPAPQPSPALDQALRRRCPGVGLLHHSDQGSTYASEDYQEVLREHGITCSMSRRGNCHDNAAMESWFLDLQGSSSGRPSSPSAAARTWRSTTSRCSTNQQRRHSVHRVPGQPAEHERRFHDEQLAGRGVTAAMAHMYNKTSATVGRGATVPIVYNKTRGAALASRQHQAGRPG